MGIYFFLVISDRNLSELFPNIFFSRKLNEDTELQLSYTRRISRPTYNDLASYITYNDPVSVFTGNPLLKPVLPIILSLFIISAVILFLFLPVRMTIRCTGADSERTF